MKLNELDRAAYVIGGVAEWMYWQNGFTTSFPIIRMDNGMFEFPDYDGEDTGGSRMVPPGNAAMRLPALALVAIEADDWTLASHIMKSPGIPDPAFDDIAHALLNGSVERARELFERSQE